MKKGLIEEIKEISEKPYSEKEGKLLREKIKELTIKYGGLKEILIYSYLLTEEFDEDDF